MRLRGALVGAAALLLGAAGCAASHHPTRAAVLGAPTSSDAMLRVVDEPAPIAFARIVVADWAVPLSGLLNLDHPSAQAAGLVDREEPIQIYLYVLEHPRFGRFLVDSGISAELADPTQSARLSFLVRSSMNTDALRVRTTTPAWLAEHGGSVDGVFLTHIHLDHIMGLSELPSDTAVYAGPGETTASRLLHMFTRGTTDRLLAESPPISVWRFERDPSGRFAGVIDVFGDGSVFALHVPGHTPGSTAYLVRTPSGPRLLVGDASHTAFGWSNGVEPGGFSLDQPRSAESLAALRKLVEAHPSIEVHLGHQSLDGSHVTRSAGARAGAGSPED